jgi:protein arginine kinase activator
MKCQQCEKPATFHITELADDVPEELHLCEEHARIYLMQAEEPDELVPSIAGALAQHLKISQTAEELSQLDKRQCPICDITFYDFRNAGRLGCPHDYVCFGDELEPLILSIHGAIVHTGKQPSRGTPVTDKQTELIRMRRELETTVEQENYERASELRDQIKSLEQENESA